MTPENYSKLSDLTVFAKERDHTLNELAHAWLLSHPMVSSVISGATRTEHVQANAASGEWELTSDEIVAIREILDKA
jgi:aryl-alcohol dehydrogenase-like predicted oxidoreductase